MADNKRLQNAKAEKNGEYYTEYSTISNEMGHYRDQLRGQVVYCNCDDPSWSNFWKYFHSNFASLGLKKLISTHYQKDSDSSYAMIYEGGDDFNMDAGKIVEIHGNTAVVNGKEVFYAAGDFRSKACLDFLDVATVVATNPPFFLFREYLACLIEHGKKFLILGNQNASHNKDIFPLFKDNKLWYGASIHSGGVDFRIPDDYENYSDNVFIKDEHHYVSLSGIRWFTNLDVAYRHDGLWHKNGTFDNSQAHCYYEGNENSYPTYVNFDGIHVASSNSIPIDYDGFMGVPITILDKLNPDEIELVGSSGDRAFAKRIEECVPPESSYTKGGPSFYLHDGGNKYKRCYSRLIIRNRNPIKKADDLGY